MRRNHQLRRLKPEGLWRAPFTDEQVEQAIAFGIATAAEGELAIHEVFNIEVNKATEAIVNCSTLFERLAVLAAQQTSRNEPIDRDQIDAMRHNPVFATHYTLDIISPHKSLNVVRFFPGERVEMEVAYRAQLANGSHRLVAAFPYRDIDYAKAQSLDASLIGSTFDTTDQFELSFKKLFSKVAADVLFDTRLFH